MPTYIVSAAAGLLSLDAKQAIAEAITVSHNKVTGANMFFAQVIFQDVPQGNHFMGGRPLRHDHIFVHGHVRSGRTREQKADLLNRIVDGICQVTDVPKVNVWGYISELPPSHMIEYGEILPEPGEEAQWMESLAPEVRNFMANIER
ncbi:MULTISPECIES: tautomerase family protein [Cupriavidus]|uniref:Phenylpyruvate tautomerase PptA (4-oxalocrotonate tautomerase family) n=2 Tax=Cupriavidus TaxID=106589 RepID=A0A7W4VGN1_9BURK|nr:MULTISPECIES: tautomerase family protein [Cupriavidus]MBB3011282.1 phenylpyruvate tautomerase PptA (4-oxalocrotonate tautomerase family) [Cupriavidus alkaliphilus]QBY56292.1 4-oxalocrotonate tautomerase [Cupriavidus oxalaticus]